MNVASIILRKQNSILDNSIQHDELIHHPADAYCGVVLILIVPFHSEAKLQALQHCSPIVLAYYLVRMMSIIRNRSPRSGVTATRGIAA
jgi:hypothetical protein